MSAVALRYDFSKISELKANVDKQAASKSFDLDSNLTLLRFYLFNNVTDAAEVKVIVKILLLALTKLPSWHYRACYHLLSEKVKAEESVVRVASLGDALEGKNFTKFWAEVQANPDTTAPIAWFLDAARDHISWSLSISFRRTSLQILSKSLSLAVGSALDAFIAERQRTSGWRMQQGVVAFPENGHNQKAVTRAQEPIRLEQVSPVLRAISSKSA